MSNSLLKNLPQFRLDFGKLKVSHETPEVPQKSADIAPSVTSSERLRRKKKKKSGSTSNSSPSKDPLVSSEKVTFGGKAADSSMIELEGAVSTALVSSAPNSNSEIPKSTSASGSKKRRSSSGMMPPPQAKRAEKSPLVSERRETFQIGNTPPISDPGTFPATSSVQETLASAHPFSFTYDGEEPILNNRRECARLLDILKGADKKSRLSDAERLAYSEEAAFYLLKAATFYNHLAADGENRGAFSDPSHGGWEDEKRAMLAEVAKTKAELAKAKDEVIAAASRTKAESLKVREAEAKIKNLEGRLSEKSSAAIALPAIKMNPPKPLSEEKESSEGRNSRLNAISECKGKLDRIRDFISRMRTHNLLIQSFNQARAKCDLITLLEKDGVAIPPLIKGELSNQIRRAEEQLKSHPAPILHPSELEPPSLYPCKKNPSQVLRPGSSRPSLPPIPCSDDVSMIVPSGLNEHGSNDQMFL